MILIILTIWAFALAITIGGSKEDVLILILWQCIMEDTMFWAKS